jgi:hypothetical protein
MFTVLEDGGARIADGEPRRPDRLLAAEIAAGLEREADLPGVLPLVVRAFEAFQLLQHLAPALGLLGLLTGEVAADEVLGLVDVLLLSLVLGPRPLDPRLALDDVLVVAIRIADEFAVLELDDLPADRPDERAIVRHQHEGARILGEICLEPLDRGQVEVVRRLVHQQEIRLANQHLGELEPASLAARERVDAADEIGLGEPHVGGQAFDARLELVAALALVALLQFAVAREIARIASPEPRLDLRKLIVDALEISERDEQRVHDGPAARQLL